MSDFYSLYHHGLIRTAIGIPALKVADPLYNAAETLTLARQAHEHRAALILFPELGLSAYSNEDLFHQDVLLDTSLTALASVLDGSRPLSPVIVVGLPLRIDQRLFNCAVVMQRGRILGVVPKSYLPCYREFYEKRQFSAARGAVSDCITLLEQTVPFGTDMLFCSDNLPNFVLAVEICEDAWTPIPPSTWAALAGATVIANLSASNITVGKAAQRRQTCAAHSARCIAAYLYSAAGPGESTTDMAWDGHAMIYEHAELLAESERFANGPQLLYADVDLERLVQERSRQTSFADSGADYRERLLKMHRVLFKTDIPSRPVWLERTIERFPFVPDDLGQRDQHCFETYNIQVHGLLKRLHHSGIEKVVIGVSGGLDSTQALIVAARTMDRLGLPRSHILGYTLPGFATSERTRRNAHALMQALGVSAAEIDIRPACRQMLQDIGHPFTEGQPVYDITFENVQAGQRTSHLFRLANQHQALVLGTGDLSELALGWTTYGVGDHMSHYNVNASLPKTLIQYLLRWVISSQQFDAATHEVLQSIIDTEISPELVPGADADQPAQRTESQIGPYALQDFNLYYMTRFGFRPSKVAFLALHAWGDRANGRWPDDLPLEQRPEYDLATIRHWLEVFIQRFFQTSQFKRTCVPNSPKVSSGGCLSPRSDWRAPSDAEARAWLEELRSHVPTD